MSKQISLQQNTNDIRIATTQNIVTVVNPDTTAVNVTQPTTAVVEVLTGPMGPKGDLSLSGSVSFTGSYVISGSLVVSGSITSTEGITGSLYGTSSWAVNAETASYVNPLTQNVIITGSLTVSGSSTFTNIGPAIFSGSVNGKEGFTGSFLGDLTGTASYVEFASVDGLISYSSSVSTRLGDLEIFSSSLDATFATDAQLNSYTASANARLDALEVESGSIRSNFNTFTSSYSIDSASFSSRVSTNESNISSLQSFSSSLDTIFATDAELNTATASLSASIADLSSSYLSTSASFSTGISANAGGIATLSSSFVSFSSSYNTGSYTGSFTGDGAGLYNIPASGIVGLNLSQITSGSVSASISPDKGLEVNTNITATSFTGSLQGTSSWSEDAISASYAKTAPDYLPLTGGTIAGNLIINGTASITFLNVTYESASVIYSTGSNQFGDASDDTQTLFGTVNIPTGSLIITGSVTSTSGFTGSLLGTSSYAISASHALTASYVQLSGVDGFAVYSSSISNRVTNLENFSSSLDATFATDAQLNAATASLSSSIASLSSSYLSTSASFSSGINANTNSISALSSSFIAFSGSYNTGSFTGSFTGDGSGLYNIPASGIVGLNLNQITSGSVSASISPDKGLEVNTNVTATSFTGSLSGTSSWASNAVTSSYAETASLAPAYLPLAGGTITGDLVVNGTASITYLSVTYESASVIYSSGSNQFGDAIDDTQTLFGSVIIPTGSLTVTGSVVSTTGFSGSLFGTSSWASNAISSSYALSASYAVSASHALNADNAISASYALTASYVNPLNQAVIITGSLNLTGSAVLTGSTVINGLTYPTADNGEFSFMQTDGLGNLTLQYVNTLYEVVYNGEATQITKGTPIYISGSQGANSKAYRADAGDPTKMPVVYIAADNINPSNTGRAIALGLITGVDTTGYPGGTEIYVGVGGGWTSARPTGSAIIQVLGYVTKEGNGGQGVVLNSGPANLPNILSGSVWVGNSGSVPTAVPTSSLSVASAVTASYAFTASYIDGGFY